jgi:hypothetical protein
MVLDRRAFLTGAGLAAGATMTAIAWQFHHRLLPEAVTATGASPATDPTTDWAADHIFGTYPPYAHPIPYGCPADAPAVLPDTGSFDPILMI